MGRALGDAAYAAGLVAVEDRHVLADSDLSRGLIQFGEIRIGRAPLDVVELDARDLELASQLHQGEHHALRSRHALRRTADRGDPAEIGRRMGPAVGPAEVHQLAGGEVGGQT